MKTILTALAVLAALLLLAILYSLNGTELSDSDDRQRPSLTNQVTNSNPQITPETTASNFKDKYDPGIQQVAPEVTEDVVNLIEFEEADLSLIDDSDVQAVLRDIPINRYRVVKIDADKLRSIIGDETQNEVVNFKLFNDSIYQATKRKSKSYFEGPRAGAVSWIGHVEDDPTAGIVVGVMPSGLTSINVFGNSGNYNTFELPQGGYYVIADLIYIGGRID